MHNTPVTVTQSIVPEIREMADDELEEPQETRAEREVLVPESPFRATGFTPRRIEKLTTRRLPRNSLHVELNHRLRSTIDESTHGHQGILYQLWLEAGKHSPPYPQKPDSQYNSNVWRNFRENCGFNINARGRKVSEMIASMYPINVPAPSRVGEYTYTKFLKETPLIADPKFRQLAIRKTQQDLADIQQLKIRTESRNPPINLKGNILPPMHYKRYEHSNFPPVEDIMQGAVAHPGETRVDIFGKRVPKLSHTPYLWKLSFRTNHPDMKRVQENVQEQQQLKNGQQSVRVTTVT